MTRRRHIRRIWLIFLAGVLLLKVIVLLQLRDHPLLAPDAGLDTSAYVDLARRVVSGDLALGPGVYYVSPLYIYWLAAGLAVLRSFTAIRGAQLLLGTATVGCIFLIADAWWGRRAAWLAAMLAATTGLFTFYEVLILPASIDPFLTATALLALTFALRRRAQPALGVARAEPLRFLIAGLIFGVQTLNRPNVLLAAGAIALLLAATRRVRPAVLVALGLVAGLAPVAVRNVLVAHEWSLVSSHGGLNFYVGNSETATGFYSAVPGITPTIVGQEKDARRLAEHAVGHPLTDSEVSDYFRDLGLAWIREHPTRAAALFVRKLAYVFSAQHVALPHSYPFYAYDEHTALRWYVVGPWLLIPLGLVGLVWRAPVEPRAEYWIWASFVPAYAIAVAVFFVAERYRLPLLVPLCVGAGAFLDGAVARLRGGRAHLNDRGSIVAVAAVVLLAVLVNWPTGLQDGRWEEGLRLAQRLVILGRYDEADQWASRIRPREPRPGATAYGLGAQLLAGGEPQRAVAPLTAAHAAAPEDARVEYALGQALLRSGRAAESIPHLRRGFEAGVELPSGGFDYAVALRAAGDSAGAANAIRRVHPSDPDDPEAWLQLGRFAAEIGSPAVADPFFERAAQLQPGRAAAHQQFGLNLLVLGRFEDCLRELAEAARLDARDPDTLSHLAYCELKTNHLADARTHADAALALDPSDDLAKQLAVALSRGR